jgi:hypothetical protein
VTPTAVAADLLRRFLAGHGRRHTFRPEDDLDVFHRWLRVTDLADQWRRARGLAGQATDGGLLAAVAHEHPELVTGSATDRRTVHESGPAMIRDLNRPTPAELCRVRLTGISLISAVLRDDLGSVYQLSPRTAGDGAYLSVALAEVAAELIAATGRDPDELVDQLRGQTVRNQATGGRP